MICLILELGLSPRKNEDVDDVLLALSVVFISLFLKSLRSISMGGLLRFEFFHVVMPGER